MATRHSIGWSTLLMVAACHGSVLVNESSGDDPAVVAEPCEPGVVEVCGELPAALDGVGVCSKGERVCLADGSGFSTCEGLVLPSAEDCTSVADETCDGEGACVGAADVAVASPGEGTHVGYGVVQQADGSMVVVGGFEGVLDLGGYPLKSDDVGDAFVIKLSADGTPLWSLSAGGSATAKAVTLNSAGELVVAGEFVGAVNFGPGEMNSQSAQADIFTLRLAQNGEVLSQRRYGSGPQEYVTGLAAGPDGSVALVGGTNGASSLGGKTVDHFGETDVLVMGLTPEHDVAWVHTFGGASWDYGHGIAVNSLGDVAIATSCTGAGQANFGDTVLCDEAGQAVVIAFDNQGKRRWTRSAGGEGPDQARSIAANSKDEWILGGLFTSTLNFGADPLTAPGSYQGYLTALDGDGGHLFSRSIDSPAGSQNYVTDLAVDTADNIVVFGSYRGTVQMDDIIHQSADQYGHLFAAKFDSTGAVAWSNEFGDSSNQRARDVTVGLLGEVVVTGDYVGKLDFGDDVVAPFTGPDPGYKLFVARFTP